tara:strand:- start:39636 stop:40142 length:507 start_codon:yes stop_codon:yes gene_type:complete
MKTVSHNQILSYFESLAIAHTLIDGFYRYNWEEIKSALKYKVKADKFVCLMESHAGRIDQPGTSPLNRRTVSLLFLKTCQPGDYDGQNNTLDTSEQILLDFVARIQEDSKNLRHDSPLRWLRGFDINSCAYDNGGPLFINMYGYNLIIELPGTADVCYDDDVKARFGV